MRKSIHEILVESYDICDELEKLQNIYKYSDSIFDSNSALSLYEYNKKYFSQYTLKKTCFDLDEYIDKINPFINFPFIKGCGQEAIIEAAFTAIEFYYNMIEFANRTIQYLRSRVSISRHVDYRGLYAFEMMQVIIAELFDQIQGKAIEIEPEKFVIITVNDEAVAVAENAKNANTALLVLKYNHFRIKGDLAAKKIILFALANDLEPERAILKSQACDDFFFIVNNADIRHNNTEKNGKSITNDLSDPEIEAIYDLAYNLYLLSKLSLEYNNSWQMAIKSYKL